MRKFIIAVTDDYKMRRNLSSIEGFRFRWYDMTLSNGDEEKLAQLRAKYPDVSFKLVINS